MSTLNKQSQSPHPDVAQDEKAHFPYTIEKVGMHKVEVPIKFKNKAGETLTLPTRMDLQVNLNQREIKGIHMSRLYKTAVEHFDHTPLTSLSLQDFMKKMVSVQGDISDKAYAQINFELPVRKKSLLSQNRGWKYYPVSLDLSYDGQQISYTVSIDFTYSSTCPCSAALSRQLLVDKFHAEFNGHETLRKDKIEEWLSKEENMGGAPHSQRSTSTIKLRYGSLHNTPELEDIISQVEHELKTPVQSFVKRQDEQEFARLNAENLLFSEDAVRLFKHIFENDSRVSDYFIYVEHFESLHPHNAVATVVKGVEGGFQV